MAGVRAGVFSMSARSPERRDREYLEWHALDHLPEQYRIPELRSGTRWVSTPACRAARAASTARYDAVDHVVGYLFADPLDDALAAFFSLGAALREAGRMPLRLPLVELGGFELRATLAAAGALVDATVLPWRPARGVYLLAEDGAAADVATLLDVEGVAGAWSFDGSDAIHPRLAATAGVRLTLLYLDEDPPAVAARLTEVLHVRWHDASLTPLLAAPFVAVVPWRWDAALPH